MNQTMEVDQNSSPLWTHNIKPYIFFFGRKNWEILVNIIDNHLEFLKSLSDL